MMFFSSLRSRALASSTHSHSLPHSLPHTLTRSFRSPLPKRLILVRHAESLGNKDEEAYESTPDHHITLTKKGKVQAHNLGNRLRRLIKDEPLLVYCSPYKRTKQTLYYIMESFKDSDVYDCREEPRLAGM
jgi:broad specificity phosphatase PhoE